MSDIHDQADAKLQMPHFEDRLWAELSTAYGHRPEARRDGARRWSPRHQPGRRPLVLGAVTLAAAVTLTVIAVARTGSDDGRRPPDRTEAIDIPDPGLVVSRVLEATEPAAQEPAIVHETRSWGEGIDREEIWYDEVTFARRELTTTADGEPLLDAGWPRPPTLADTASEPRQPPVTGFDQCVGGLAMDEEGNIYSCDSGEPASGLPPAHPHRVVNHCSSLYVETAAPLMQEPGWGYLRLFLETGDIVVDGGDERDGKQLIRLRNRDGSYTFLVDPETYLPVEAIEATPGSPRVAKTYERLERTEENLALLTPTLPDGYERTVDDEVFHAEVPDYYVCEENPPSEAEIVGAISPEVEERICNGDDPEDLVEEGALTHEELDRGLALSCAPDSDIFDDDGALLVGVVSVTLDETAEVLDDGALGYRSGG